jgi:exonuclease SbcC
MRIHRLEIFGIGPFRDRQVIDFDALSVSGLFLIDGPTGSGKTTIIDSITYALFSSLSGEESAKDRMRSDFSVGSDRSEIILDFSVSGVKHTLTRGIPYSFAKANGEGETKRAATQSLIRFGAGGMQDLALTHANEIGTYLVDLLHLNAQQFRQLVVLAQGEFAALLRMNPSKRLEALRDLLGDSYYQKLQTELDERGKAAQVTVSSARSATRDIAVQIQGLLTPTDPQELQDQVSELVDASAPDPAAVTQAVIAHCEAGVEVARAELRSAQAVAQPLEIRFSELAQIKASLDEVVRARELALMAKAELSSGEIDLTLEEIPAIITRTREQIGQLKPLVDWQLGHSQRVSQREELLAEQEKCISMYEQLHQAIDTYPQTSTQLKSALTESQQATIVVEQREAQISAHDEIRENLEKLASLHELCRRNEEALHDKKEQLDSHEHSVTKAELTLSQAIRAQLTQRVVVLAGQLREGDPCSVCGSLTHPQPASVEIGIDVVTEEQIENLESSLESAKATRDSHKRELAELGSELDSKKLAVASLSAICGDKSLESVAAELESLSSELVATRELAEQLERREADLNELELSFVESKKSIIDAESAREIANNALLKFDTEVELKDAELAQLIDSELNATDELNELESTTVRLTTWLEASRHLEKVSKSLTPEMRELDPIECANSFDNVELELTLAREGVEQAEETRTLSESLLKSANALVTKYANESQGIEKLVAEVKDAVGLGALVTATSSINTKKLTLESYALQLRFAHVLESASIHLRKMSSGRLSFLLDESSQGRGNTGLGINVMDEATGDARPTASLSGGETFYASLSLALGLADVVQSETGGVSLETLFVDEGFGSLDTDTLERVLDQLDQLKSGGRTIGVISHVSEMKDRFPDRIVVSRDPEGPSRILQG